MTKAKPRPLRICGLLLCLTCTAGGQVTFPPLDFVNLDFEHAQNVPDAPSPEPWGWDPMMASDAFRFWTTFSGEPELEIDFGPFVAHNRWYDWIPSVVLFDLHSAYVIEGGYTAGLKAGFDLLGDPHSASIAQTGLIPPGSQSLQIKIANGSSGFHVSISGQEIQLAPIQSSANYILYAGDVSQFSGVLNDLKISVEGGESRIIFDSIGFSPEAIPEPNAVLLGIVGFLLLIGMMRRRKSSHQSLMPML